MKWRGRRQSSNVRRGGSGGGGFSFPGLSGGRSGSPMGRPGGILPVGGIGGIIILLLIYFLGNGLGGPSETAQQDFNNARSTGTQAGQVQGSDFKYQNDLEEFLSVVLADTEDVWHELFRDEGSTYREPTLVLYSGQTQTGCGIGDSRMGPFYCPADQSIYIDPSFYAELRDKFDAPGDFAFAYVLAHEVGHHVQNLLGITDEVFKMKGRMSETQFNTEYLVRLELQADYMAGVFANHVQDKGYLEKGDIEEAMNAAAAVGDDTIQRKMTGNVSPDNFTHGTSEQRMRWFNAGYEAGDLSESDTFRIDSDSLQSVLPSYAKTKKLELVA